MDTLPVDAIIKIVFFIPDPEDLFAFLGTLRPHIALGPLEDLYQLGLAHDHSSLWPALTLDCLMKDTLSIVLCESIAKLYSQVLINDSWFSVDWLKKHLNPIAAIEWGSDEFPSTIAKKDDWVDLRITRLYLFNKKDTPETWKMVVPRMHYLKSLSIEGNGDLAEVYRFVVKSAPITELQINPIDFQVGNAELLHIIEWFRRQPVREFEECFTDWSDLDYDLRQELCEVMFNCPTMDRLCLSSAYLNQMDFTKFCFPMSTLQLHSCDIYRDGLKLLASRLMDSKLTNLELFDYLEDDDIDGMECLLHSPLWHTYSLERDLNITELFIVSLFYVVK
ncbi:hypothetical protein Ae201684P_006867 [Aphanomyces euteiches]|uniref:F-box domain-containing protein n=1 Tax=Aphanomyces euteiches TaxID=100861 RepID=A0A6G0WV06_9STRA|nr:hypothetical protein Ae201684_011421 [Aphanomyces euteiches]KAH9100672.1 hypothetical protein Ae201684P_006867 [Aphanomyces euteiches]KAH9142728.1 hypothetical protein AeRB84_013218 [Aphanomyces euteiches]